MKIYVPVIRSNNSCRILTEIMSRRGIEIEIEKDSLLENGITFYVNEEDATFLTLSVPANELGRILAGEVTGGILASMQAHKYEWK